ncbi:YczI family protein [Bacillus sp. V3B]|uniref:YczI family protein n=1 Tax=Bacillus sp. V3B TaxID=2804915 RepID=UPI00210BA9A7|nr:YczI family protein [Bacillus sp. V3B]MCQ6277535.1 YczI family protein [Bacillus sp. V3B]
MLKISRVILAVIVITMAGYGLLTENHWLQPYMLFFLGLMMLVMGLEEFQKGRKVYGYLSLFVFMFLLIVLFIT